MSQLTDDNIQDKDYAYWVKSAARASIVVAVLLLVLKIYAWLASDAASMLSSATDSLLDVFASVMNFIILRYALMPADDDHRFGHGKAESLAGIVQSSFILGSSILLMLHGTSRVLSPVKIENSTIAIIVSVVAVVVTLALVMFQRFVIRKTGSVAISADSLHYQSDLLLNAGVIAALLLTNFVWSGIDGLFTILVGAYLAYGASKIAMTSINHLMDKELSEEDIKLITETVNKHPDVLGVHDIRTRQAGAVKFIQFHLELDDNLPLYQAHQISDEVEANVAMLFESAEIFIHQDPHSMVLTHRMANQTDDTN